MTTKNKFILGTVALLVLLAIYGYSKLQKIQQTFSKLVIVLYGYPKNIKITWNGIVPEEISFDMGIRIDNTDNEDFFVTGVSIAELSRVDMIYNNQIFATAKLGLQELSIEARKSQIIENVRFVVPAEILINNLSNLSAIASKATYIGFVNVAGTEIQIGA